MAYVIMSITFISSRIEKQIKYLNSKTIYVLILMISQGTDTCLSNSLPLSSICSPSSSHYRDANIIAVILN